MDNQLPQGYVLEQDDDGDWVLSPPQDVIIFSTPGEGLLIGSCDFETATQDALAYLGAIEANAQAVVD